MIAASVKTRVVSWNDAAEMNESVESDALRYPAACAQTGPAPSVGFDTIVFGQQFRTLNLLTCNELAVARVRDGHATQHLANDHLNVLVVDLHALQSVNLLNFINDVLGERFHTQQTQNIVGSAGPSTISSPLFTT